MKRWLKVSAVIGFIVVAMACACLSLAQPLLPSRLTLFLLLCFIEIAWARSSVGFIVSHAAITLPLTSSAWPSRSTVWSGLFALIRFATMLRERTSERTRGDGDVKSPERSNQAMQLTASKPDVYAVSVCHPRFFRASMPHRARGS